MAMFYSKSTGGFYDTEINGTSMPDDVVEISDQDHAALLLAQSNGKRIVADENGYPVAVDYPAATREQLIEIASAHRDSLLRTAAVRIAPLQDAVDLGMASDADVARLSEWKKYRVAVNRIDQQAGYPGLVDWPTVPA